MKNRKVNVRKLTVMAMLVAVSIVLVWILHVPIIPAASFLEYDPADIPILICTFAYGPVAGIIVTVLAALIQGFTVSAASGVYGIIMHIIATSVFVISAGLIYRAKKTRMQALIALVVGVICMTAVMIPANLLITPVFMGSPVEAVKQLLLPGIIPFNLIKAGINAVVTFFVYKPVSKLMEKGKAK